MRDHNDWSVGGTQKSNISIFEATAASVKIVICVGSLAVVVHAGAAKPRSASFDLTISNKECFRGKGIDPYVQKAIAQRRLAARQANAGELATFYIAVPSRAWRGLTVTGVGLHYESTSIYFGEPVAKVRRVLRGFGVSVEADGSIAITNKQAAEFLALRTTTGEARRFGASRVECGI